MSRKLYKVSGPRYHIFVIAQSLNEAENMYVSWIRKHDFGGIHDADVLKVEAIASTNSEPSTGLDSIQLLIE